MIQSEPIRVLVLTRTNGQLLERIRATLDSWNMLDRTKISMQVTIIHWIALLFSSATLIAVLLVMLSDRWIYDPVFIIAFGVTSFVIPISLSVGGTIHLSGIGEKRVLSTTGINLLAIPLVVVLECARYGQDLSTLTARSTLLGVYLLVLGYVQPLLTKPILGVSGGRSQCKTETVVLDRNFSDLKTLLSQPMISETLEVGSLEESKEKEFCILRTPENVGFNCFIFLFAHPRDANKSVLLFIGYSRTDYEIMGDTAARNSLRGKRIYLLALLNQNVSLEPPSTLVSFLEEFPEFVYSSNKAYRLALEPTEIPLSQIKYIPASAVALLLAIIVPILVAAFLYVGGLLPAPDLIGALLPTFILIGVELLLFRLGRKG